MKCADFVKQFEMEIPTSFALPWDNVGLLVGREDKDIHKIYVAVDATKDVIEAAIAAGADLLLTHHPLLFKPVRNLQGSDFIGERLLMLAETGMCYYAAHTNFDVMGMADAVSDQLALSDRKVLAVTYEDDLAPEGIGRVGALPRTMTLAECAEHVKKSCQVNQVKVFGDPSETVVMAAVCPGSGKGEVEHAIGLGADVLITGDIDHHEGIDAVARGISIIDAGHYGLEKVFVPYIGQFLRRNFPELVVLEAPVINPFWVI